MDIKTISMSEFEIKLWWPILKFYPDIYLVGFNKTSIGYYVIYHATGKQKFITKIHPLHLTLYNQLS